MVFVWPSPSRRPLYDVFSPLGAVSKASCCNSSGCIQMVRTAEMFRANFEHVNDMIPHYNATRKVNLGECCFSKLLFGLECQRFAATGA